MYGPNESHKNTMASVIYHLNQQLSVSDKIKLFSGSHGYTSGEQRRDFVYVDDAAQAAILAAERYEKNEPINIGSGKEITIKELVKLIKNLMNADNLTIKWNNLKPNGQPRRCLDIEKAKKELGFIPKISIEEGLRRTIELFENTNKA